MKNRITVTLIDGEKYTYKGMDYRCGVAPEDAKMLIISDDEGIRAMHYEWYHVSVERDV